MNTAMPTPQPLQPLQPLQPGQAAPMTSVGGASQGDPRQPYMLTPEQQQAIMLAQAAKRQQAMQASQGQPPTVVQALRQQVGAQMPQQQTGGVDQLPSNIQMAGGGIVGFSGVNGSLVGEEDELNSIPGFQRGDSFQRALAEAKAEPDAQVRQRKMSAIMRAFGGDSGGETQDPMGSDLMRLIMENSVPGGTPAPPRGRNRSERDVGQTPYVPKTSPAGGIAALVNPPTGQRRSVSAQQTQTTQQPGAAQPRPVSQEDELLRMFMERAKADPQAAAELARKAAAANDGSEAYFKEREALRGERTRVDPRQNTSGLDHLISFLKGATDAQDTQAKNGYKNNDWRTIAGGAIGLSDAEQARRDAQKAKEDAAREAGLRYREADAEKRLAVTGTQNAAGVTAADKATTRTDTALSGAASRTGSMESRAMEQARMEQQAAQFAETKKLQEREFNHRVQEAQSGKAERKQRVAYLTNLQKGLNAEMAPYVLKLKQSPLGKLSPEDTAVYARLQQVQAELNQQLAQLGEVSMPSLQGSGSTMANFGAPPPGAVKRIGN